MTITNTNTVTIIMAKEDKNFLAEITHWICAKREEVWANGYVVPEDLWELLKTLEDTANQLYELKSITYNLEHCAK